MLISELYQYFKASAGIQTDSRAVQEGQFFFALKGENFDGNAYALDALEKGAAFAVVDNNTIAAKHERIFFVEDVLQALQHLARFHRQQWDIPVLAITGSNGKTTTKELVRDVLATTYEVYATKGNLNNHIGVPLTLLSVPSNAEFVVCEMGANHQKEIDVLSHIAEPSHGLITNIGYAHIEGFGGLEGVKKGKSELYKYLDKQDGVIFANADERFLIDELMPSNAKLISYGQKAPIHSRAQQHIQVQLQQTEPAIKYAFSKQGETYTGSSPLFGKHNFANIATAVAVGQYFGVAPNAIVNAIAAYNPQMNRSQRLQSGNTELILDAYNANPSSMQQAMQAFAAMPDNKFKGVILGGMNELGEQSQQLHQQIVDLAESLPIQQLILVGQHYKQINLNDTSTWFESTEALANWWRQYIQKNEQACWLVKGSRSFKLETIFFKSTDGR